MGNFIKLSCHILSAEVQANCRLEIKMSSEIKLIERTEAYYCLIQRGVISMRTNFKMLPKTNHMSETKCLTVFFGQLMALSCIIACSNPRVS